MNPSASPPSSLSQSLAASRPGEVLDIRSVGFTSIKGTRHLVRPDAEFDDWGPVGDRRYCLIDVEKRQVLRTVQHPSLLAVVAQFHGDELETTLPDGRTVCAVPKTHGQSLTCEYWGRPVEAELLQGPHDVLLSSWLDKPVRLAQVPRGDVVYGEPLSIVSTASIADLGERLGDSDLLAEAARFRATFLVTTGIPYIEETWTGQEMSLSNGVRVRIGEAIPRCAVIDLDPHTGVRGSRLLKTLAKHRGGNDKGEPFFGVYARVVGAG